MIICTVEQCAVCLLVAGSGDCLRRQAQKCLHLSKRVFSRGVQDTLEDLSLLLMDEASTVDKKPTTPPSGAI
jgi:hypothetical protein